MAPIPPAYTGLDSSWRALLSAFLELFAACLVLFTAAVSLITAKLIRFFELPHPCSFLGLHHERSLLCEQHRRMALLSLDYQPCVECLRGENNRILPLYRSTEACQNCYVKERLDNVQDKLLDEECAQKKNNKPADGWKDEDGVASVVWYERRNSGADQSAGFRSGPTGDRCVKRKFAKIFVEERANDQEQQQVGGKVEIKTAAEGKAEDVILVDGDLSADLETKEASDHGRTMTDAAEISVESVKAAFQAEKDALGSLYAELEEERNASAIAANEAMAMITRLQEEKAAVQMEARQYQRMVEEKAEYDQEAITLLKEILFKREQEKFVLEREVESYRKTLLTSAARDEWDLEEVKVPLPLPFQKPLFLEGGSRKADVLRGVNLLENFESASTDKAGLGLGLKSASPGDDREDSGGHLNFRYSVDEASENGGGSCEDEFTKAQGFIGDNDELLRRSTDLDLRTTSMVMRDNFRLAMEDDIRELTSRLQVLEDDRQFMKQIVYSLKAEKQELQELAQNLREMRAPPSSSSQDHSTATKFGELLNEEGAVLTVPQVASLKKKRRMSFVEQAEQDLTGPAKV